MAAQVASLLTDNLNTLDYNQYNTHKPHMLTDRILMKRLMQTNNITQTQSRQSLKNRLVSVTLSTTVQSHNVSSTPFCPASVQWETGTCFL